MPFRLEYTLIEKEIVMSELNRKQIASILPHTGPMLLPDYFSCCKEGMEVKDDRLVGKGVMFIEKPTFARNIFNKIFGGFFPNLLRNSFFVENHFNCLPGVMLIEFAAQTAALLVKTNREIEGLPIVLRFKDPAPEFGKFMTTYGDIIHATVKLIKDKRGMFYFEAELIKNDGTIVLETGIAGAAAPTKGKEAN